MQVRYRSGSKLNYDQAQDIRARCAAGESQKTVAQIYGVKSCTVNKIVHGLRNMLPPPTPEQRKAHREAQQAAWRDKNPERARLNARMVNHRTRAAGSVTACQWLEIVRSFDERCAYCGVQDKLTIDHVIPVAQGGLNTPDNVVPACGSCNFVKGRQGPLAMVNRRYELRNA